MSNALVITNFPHDDGERGRPDPEKLGFTSQPQYPRKAFAHPEIIRDIEVAVKQYGNVTQQFPEQ